MDSLAELKWLVVSLNKITKIEGLDKLERLETLNFDHNQIEKI
jgi:Leucine-rich repeat (LRR) protein